MSKICPHCEKEIEHLLFDCDYNCNTWGKAYGSCDFNGEDEDFDEHDDRDSGDYNYDDYEYRCPECDHELFIEDFDDQEDITISDKIKEKKKKFIESLI